MENNLELDFVIEEEVEKYKGNSTTAQTQGFEAGFRACDKLFRSVERKNFDEFIKNYDSLLLDLVTPTCSLDTIKHELELVFLAGQLKGQQEKWTDKDMEQAFFNGDREDVNFTSWLQHYKTLTNK